MGEAPRFTLRQLEACIVASELRNFSAVAKRMHLSPSAISNIVTEFEDALGFVMFERNTRKVALTPAGRQFLPAAIALQQQFRRAQAAALDIRRSATDVVRVAAPMGLAASILPPLFARLQAVSPRITAKIIDTGVDWLAERVLAGDADLAVGPLRTSQLDVACVPLFESKWVMWLRPDDPLIDLPLDWGSFRDRRVFAAGRDFEQSLRGAVPDGKSPVPQVEIVELLTTAFGMTAAGLGVTFSPIYVRALAEPFGITPRPIAIGEASRTLALYKPMGRTPPAAARAVEEFLIDALSNDSADLASLVTSPLTNATAPSR